MAKILVELNNNKNMKIFKYSKVCMIANSGMKNHKMGALQPDLVSQRPKILNVQRIHFFGKK